MHEGGPLFHLESHDSHGSHNTRSSKRKLAAPSVVILENCSLLFRSSDECEVKPGLTENSARQVHVFQGPPFKVPDELRMLRFIVFGEALWKESLAR